MRHFGLITALFTALALALPAVAQDTPTDEPIITLSRTACFGTCPAYSVAVYADGTVTYEGEQHVEVEGEATATLDPEHVDTIIQGFVAAGYFELADEYTDLTVTDMPSVTTSVTHNGEIKRVEHYLGDFDAPLELSYLESWLDEVLMTRQWTGVEQRAIVHTPDHSPVMMLERQPCFGTCPVYRVVLYRDGTVVYVGTNHVVVPGVQVSQVDAMLIQVLADKMNMSGYFQWNESYKERLVTDMPTVVTWLSTDDQMKRITRYEGDPNAPIGLVRFENEIDTLVNSAQWIEGNNGAS